MTIALLALLLALQVADGRTTYLVLSRGGRELNPLMRYAIEKLGLARALIIVKGVIACVLVEATALGYMPTWALAGLCALYLGVVGHNAWQIMRSRA